MKIYTKTGDQGETSLYGGTRVSKTHERIEAYGTVDELNSYMGLLGALEVNASRAPFIKEIQCVLFSIGSLLATAPDKSSAKLPDIDISAVERLEKEIDNMEAQLSPLQAFILPGGHKDVAFCHIARTVCRRAERLVIALSINHSVNKLIITFLNRLSDFLFVLARMMAKELQAEEIKWEPRKK